MFVQLYGAFDVVLYLVIIQLFWLLINLLLILSYLILTSAKSDFGQHSPKRCLIFNTSSQNGMYSNHFVVKAY